MVVSYFVVFLAPLVGVSLFFAIFLLIYYYSLLSPFISVINSRMCMLYSCSSVEDDEEDANVKAHREKERRQANNIRERLVI